QGEAGDDCEKRGDEASRAVLRHLDRLEVAFVRLLGLLRALALLLFPEGIDVRDLRQNGEIPGWRRRSSRPFQCAAVPRVRSHLELLAVADRDHELDYLADDPREDDDDAYRRNDQPGLPARNVVMLHAAGH